MPSANPLAIFAPRLNATEAPWMAVGSIASNAYEQWAFRNRRQLTVEEASVWIAPPEYVAVYKLEFFREGGSEKHIRDIRGMLAVTDVDRAVIEEEANARGLVAQWKLCLNDR